MREGAYERGRRDASLEMARLASILGVLLVIGPGLQIAFDRSPDYTSLIMGGIFLLAALGTHFRFRSRR